MCMLLRLRAPVPSRPIASRPIQPRHQTVPLFASCLPEPAQTLTLPFPWSLRLATKVEMTPYGRHSYAR
ncbi:hypothetical protein BS50DRAFT_163329 [Corynespora cassiicola Philippines]|uniref:Uncharacterized protein n=1 Tax=Corynespora cassiicola Philippines TaxID=1448308 RepID=A0A2T2N6N5_CORCC|nr:hypothetical protein BS50DRAFT_163329 [Corynespora cassiicola Philippines]